MSPGAGRSLAIIGWGRMGRHMGRRLLESDYPLRVHDISPEARNDAQAAGAQLFDSAAGAAHDSSCVITMLPDPAAVVAAATADEGVAQGLAAGAMWLEMSSSHPEVSRRMNEIAHSRSAKFLDAPVSGGVAGARDGTLTIMVGGPAEVLETARPILDVLGKPIVHVGPHAGHGDLAKTINNMLSAINLTAAAEGLALGLDGGLEVEALLEAVAAGTGGSHATSNKIPRYVLTGAYDAGFTIRDLLKDLRIAQEVATEGEVPTELRSLVQNMWTALAAQGHGNDDHTAVVRHILARAGVQPPDS